MLCLFASTKLSQSVLLAPAVMVTLSSFGQLSNASLETGAQGIVTEARLSHFSNA
jgi:hypothetical protein